MTAELITRQELPDDHADVAKVHALAFGVNNPVPALVDDLRMLQGAFPTTSLVACNEAGDVLGHVMLTPAWLDAPARMVDVMVLSPLGVHPDHQRAGIGTMLLSAAIAAARTLETPFLFLEGNPKYYRPRGFEMAGPMGFDRPSIRIPEAAFQVVKFDTATTEMTGRLVYREPFWAHDCVGLR